MKEQEIKDLFVRFENASSELNGVEYWSARELHSLFGYTQWRNFLPAIEKAMVSCKSAGENPDDHFAQVRKMVDLGSGAQRAVDDIYLTRYACYLIAQNGDSKKAEIAFAQNYFAVQTRRAELIQQRILESERVAERNKLKATETKLGAIVYKRGVDEKGFGILRSKGDAALFGAPTQKLKERFHSVGKPLADVLPTIGITAKNLAAEMTSINVENKDIKGLDPITHEHVDNNMAVRDMLRKRGIYTETLQPVEDVTKVERRLNSEAKKAITQGKKTRKKK